MAPARPGAMCLATRTGPPTMGRTATAPGGMDRAVAVPADGRARPCPASVSPAAASETDLRPSSRAVSCGPGPADRPGEDWRPFEIVDARILLVEDDPSIREVTAIGL